MSILDPIDESKIDYEKDKWIDVNNLHEEWLRQPGLCGDYNKLLAQAENERDKIKEQIEIARVNMAEARAQLELNIRKTPVLFDLGSDMKVTESWIANTVLIYLKKNEACIAASEALSEAQSNLIEATYKVGLYGAAVKAIIDRKTALQNEVDLWSRNYFSVPNLPRPAPEQYQKARTDAQDTAMETLRQAAIEKQNKEQPIRRARRAN